MNYDVVCTELWRHLYWIMIIFIEVWRLFWIMTLFILNYDVVYAELWRCLFAAKKLDLYQVLAPNAYAYKEEFIPVIRKTVQSQVHEVCEHWKKMKFLKENENYFTFSSTFFPSPDLEIPETRKTQDNNYKNKSVHRSPFFHFHSLKRKYCTFYFFWSPPVS